MTIYGCRQNKKQQQDNLANLEASLAPAEAEFGAVAKADQYKDILMIIGHIYYVRVRNSSNPP